MMLQRCVIALSLVAFALATCCTTPPSPGELKGFAEVCNKANEGKRIAVEGYLSFPGSFKSTSAAGPQTIMLRLTPAGRPIPDPIGVKIFFGTNANEVEKVVNLRYTDEDLKVHTANGLTVGSGTKVRVSGDVYFPIDAYPPCALENPLVEEALNK